MNTESTISFSAKASSLIGLLWDNFFQTPPPLETKHRKPNNWCMPNDHINLFSPWYNWKIAGLALNNNHSLTPKLPQPTENNIPVHQVFFFLLILTIKWNMQYERNILPVLLNLSFQDILLFNLREEPVLFVDNGSDMIPYTIRDKDNLSSQVILGRSPQEADEAEARIRKEVCDWLN